MDYHIVVAKYGEEGNILRVNRQCTLEEIIDGICSRWGIDKDILILKYQLPTQEKSLFKLNNDVDVQRMLDFHIALKSPTIEINVETSLNSGSKSTRLIDSGTICPQDVGSMALAVTASSQGSSCASGLRLARSWENAITGIGQVFKDATHFKEALRNYSIIHNKDYQFIKNDRLRVTVKCINESCPWRLHASRVGQQETFKIKTFSNTHTCGGGIGKDRHPKASKTWVADIVLQKLRDKPLYRPIDIKKDIQKDFGIHLPYKQAWLGKEVARQELHGEDYASFDLLRWYGEVVAETNPGSFFVLEYPDGHFERLFICFHACLVGFKSGCRPLLFMDGTHILNRYGGVMLAAVALDAENGMFPLAFAIVSAENDANWVWFCEKLHDAIYNNEDPYYHQLCFISDRAKGLIKGVRTSFPDAAHSYCLRHLKENFKKKLSGLSVAQREKVLSLLDSAAYALQISQFIGYISDIREISTKACEWIEHGSDINHWPNALFKGERYGEMYSNVVESFNSWAKEARQLPITLMVDMLRYKMMELMHERRNRSHEWQMYLVPKIEELINSNIEDGRGLTVRFSDGERFEVVAEGLYEVNLKTRTCTCRYWQVYGYPCSHACATIIRNHESVYTYVSEFFTVDAYRRMYEHAIFPIADISKPIGVKREDLVIKPPISKPKAGRPKKKRIESQPKEVRPLKCGRCHNVGHNRKTCNAPMPEE